MARQDHYEVLGVPQDATADEIRRAFRRLAAQHHPDRNLGDRSASLRFKQVNAAYQVLSDPAKRAVYDDLTRAPDATHTGLHEPPAKPPPQAPPRPPPPDTEQSPEQPSRSWSWRPGAPWAPQPPEAQRRSSAPPSRDPAPEPPPWVPPEWRRSSAPPSPRPPPAAAPWPPPPASAAPEERIAHPGGVRRVRRAILWAQPRVLAVSAVLGLAGSLYPLPPSEAVTAIDTTSYLPTNVPQEAAASLYEQGKIRFAGRSFGASAPGTRLPVIKEGIEGTIPAEKADVFAASGAGEFNFDPSGAAKAERAAFERGFTFGLSDWLAIEGRKLLGDDEGAERANQIRTALQHDYLGPGEPLGHLAAILLLTLNAILYLVARLVSGLRCPRCGSNLREQDERCPQCGQLFWTHGAGTHARPVVPLALLAGAIGIGVVCEWPGTRLEKPLPPVSSASFAPLYTTQMPTPDPGSGAAPAPPTIARPNRRPSTTQDLDTQCSNNAGCAQCRDMDGASTPEQRATLAPGCYARWLAPSPKPQAPENVTPAFNLGAARARLTEIASGVQSCKETGDARGIGRVVVTFSPSGDTRSAVVSGSPFEGTPTGACVADRFRGARVPPFWGDPFPVSKSFTIE